MKHKTYRGRVIDMEMLKFQNQHRVAIGNANMNARGDILGKGGVIVKTREQLLEERERALTKPDFIPEHNSHSTAPSMATTKDANLFLSPEEVKSREEAIRKPKKSKE